jgi:hypothetical protein
MGMNRHANRGNPSSLWLCLIFVDMQLNSSAAKKTEFVMTILTYSHRRSYGYAET